jgi:hypothetical protein
VCAALITAAIFGNVSSIMLRLYSGAEEYQEMQSSIKEFIRFHHIPKQLATRLSESYHTAWSYTNGVDMNSVSSQSRFGIGVMRPIRMRYCNPRGVVSRDRYSRVFPTVCKLTYVFTSTVTFSATVRPSKQAVQVTNSLISLAASNKLSNLIGWFIRNCKYCCGRVPTDAVAQV